MQAGRQRCSTCAHSEGGDAEISGAYRVGRVVAGEPSVYPNHPKNTTTRACVAYTPVLRSKIAMCADDEGRLHVRDANAKQKENNHVRISTALLPTPR